MAIVNRLPSGAGMEKELLWENPNPRQAMGNTTITVPNISDYDYIMFETYVAPLSATIPDVVYQTLCRVDDIKNKIGGYYGRPLTLSCVYSISSSSWVTFTRLIAWPSLTQCNFQTNTRINTSDQYNGINVPWKIYGVKGEIK